MTQLQEKLLEWYSANARELPWRGSYSPYQVWISEIMLQQTQVSAMLPYYSRWMKRFPDINSVALASEDEILLHWEGLGYYARAKNIRKAARQILAEFGGELPRDFDSVRRLPGIGRYTAGAIMSFAYNADYAAADANAARILSRLFDISAPWGSKEFQDAVWNRASGILPKGRARDFNQALMDFGSSVCLARTPLCEKCPVANLCESLQKGLVRSRPAARIKKTLVPVRRAAGILVRNGMILVRKRPETGLMPNLWEFPGGTAREAEDPEQALRRLWLEELGILTGRVEELGIIRHTHTGFRVTLHAYLCSEAENAAFEPRLLPSLMWIAASGLEQLAFPAAHRKLIHILLRKIR